MRKAQKQIIMNVISSLHKAHDEIKEAFNRKSIPLEQSIQIIQNMICECQQTAIQIGETIEKLEGEGHTTVTFIEEYCEMLYTVYEKISKEDINITNGNKSYKMLKKQLVKIENSVKNDITVRKEVIFLPYKASMWDSLESVYLAAKKDVNCDAYCIPIPYFDLNPDHSFGQMHYEGNEYPKNIEVTDWQEYSFEERKPDEIYIHNGYDNWNLVTSVHPRFYSSNLKKYTDKLIYIPYFIMGDIDPDDNNIAESKKHFCFMPGIINADKVILESENVKKLYVNEYLKAAKESGLTGRHIDRKYLEQKFLGIGSPKIDKVLNTKKEDIEIPTKWLEKIKKPDGTWKKIIFYNTGITALLKYNEKWIEKIEDVLKIFKENQKEVTLLWRPHPLIENTMKSMRPGILEKYLKIKKQYLEEDWGIYDDTSDVDRAVVLSDAYYGDGSSVVQMYQETGKYYVIQDCNIATTGNNLGISVSGFSKIQDSFIFKSRYSPGTYCYHCIDKTIALLEEKEENMDKQKYAYLHSIAYQNFIIFPPYFANQFTIYDNKEKKFFYLNKKIKNAYYSGLIYKDRCIFLTNNFAELTELSIKNNEIFLSYPLLNKAEISVYSFRDICQIEEKVYVPCREKDTILEYNLDNHQMRIIKVETGGMNIKTIYFDGIYFFLSGNLPFVYRISRDLKSKIDKISLPEDYIKTKEFGWDIIFSQGLMYNEYIFYAPVYYRAVIRIHRTTLEVKVIYPVKDESYSWGIKKFGEGKIYIDFVEDESFKENVVIDPEGNVLEKNIFQPNMNALTAFNFIEYRAGILEFLIEQVKNVDNHYPFSDIKKYFESL